MNKKSFPRGGKIIATLFIIFNFTSISNARIKNINTSIVFEQSFESKSLTDTGKNIISGIVKDENGNVLENTKVLFDTIAVAITDENGKFSFEPTRVTPSSHNIYFSRDSFATVVRTYYPVMSSANYNVVLYRQINLNSTKSVSVEPALTINKETVTAQPMHNRILPVVKPIVKTDTIVKINTVVKEDTVVAVKNDLSNTTTVVAAELDFPSIIFKINTTALTAQSKAFLDIISEKLKENPTTKIDIKANIPVHDYNPIIAQKRLANIVRYLVANGIAADRLNKETVVGGGELNTIDFINSK